MEDYFDTPMVRRRFEEVTSTQSPTDLSTQQKSSSGSSYANRNSSTDLEPVLTTGEKIGAFIFGSITLMIVIYFLMLPFQPFGNKKRRQRRGRSRRRSPERRRRPHGIAEREDELEDKGSLTMLGEDNLLNDCNGNNGMATAALSSPTKHDDSEDSSKASTIEMASVYSLSSDDGSPARTSAARSALNQYAKKSYSVTSAVLNAILPTASKDEENTESYYVQHDDKDNENDEVGSESTNSNISSPFHPSPTPRTTPPHFQRKKNKKFLMSNDDSVVCKTMGATTVTGITNTSATPTDDVFAGISDEDQPFDCEPDERPFDCVA